MAYRRHEVKSETFSCLFLCLLASAQAYADQLCSCESGCDNKGVIFPGSDGRRVNVAYGKSASMSSVFDRDGGSGPACAAVNGRTGTVWKTKKFSDVNCVHTADFNYKAWWQVDLGHSYTVTDITIYRRKDCALRMSGMGVYVDGQVCHSFPNRSAATNVELLALPEKIDVTCTTPLRGSVVRFEKHGNDQTYEGGSYIINLCEVQVWACKPGLYGEDCKQACSGHCKDNDTCDYYYGTCPRDCDPGWTSPSCDQTCKPGLYGEQCNQTCSGHCKNNTCDNYNGTCFLGCEPGWTSPYCDQTESDDSTLAGQMVGIGLGASFGVAAFILLIIGLCGRKSKHQKSSQTKTSPSASLDQSINTDKAVENGLDISADESVENAKNDELEYVNIASTKRNAGYSNHVYSM
ncbi:hypothetical protein V1264_020611 [Littorina saxatilis]|uniref:Fucolectin tachylectin-4 pentraxin-1 domain-containing protein n=2 Tax=Littorina saxatilis TaxID=31220 RepID=A0AAN9BAG6_9CAEN